MFVTVPVSVGSAAGGFDEAMDELTKYRRAIRRVNDDNEKLQVIFNDYMNCLFGDPTTDKEIPLIDKAAEAGCEYYCIDCGWYSEGYWWDGVGEWLPCEKRFPGGLRKLMDYIRSKGMIPGVWLELEVMGIKCPKADRVPDDWYFMRHGKRSLTGAGISLISETRRSSNTRRRSSTGLSMNTASAISRWTTTSSPASGQR